jgi:hypothetical protein
MTGIDPRSLTGTRPDPAAVGRDPRSMTGIDPRSLTGTRPDPAAVGRSPHDMMGSRPENPRSLENILSGPDANIHDYVREPRLTNEERTRRMKLLVDRAGDHPAVQALAESWVREPGQTREELARRRAALNPDQPSDNRYAPVPRHRRMMSADPGIPPPEELFWQPSSNASAHAAAHNFLQAEAARVDRLLRG